MGINLGDTQIVIFEIPYAIRIEDGFSFEEEEEGIKFELPPKEEVTEIKCGVDGYLMWLRFQQVNNSGMHLEGSFSVGGERLGNSISTRVLIHFSTEFMESIPEDILGETPENYHEVGTMFGSDVSPPLDKYLIVYSVNCLNRFLSVYRFSENEPWIRSLTPQMIQDFYLAKNEDGEFNRWRSQTWTGGPLTGGGADVEFIESITETKDVIPLLQRLRLDARDSISRTEFAVGVIQSAQLFELWSIQSFIIIAKENGHSQSEAESLILKPNGNYFNPENILDKFGSELGYRVKEEASLKFKNWKNSTKNKRNEVIHQGLEPNRTEAEAAFEATMELIYDIQSEFRTDLKNGRLVNPDGPDLPGSNILIEKTEEPPDPPDLAKDHDGSS